MNNPSYLWACCWLLSAGAAVAQGRAEASASQAVVGSTASSVEKTLRKDVIAKHKNETQVASHVSKPIRRQLTLNLTPGAPPEVVRVAVGHGTVLAFLDAAGQPWKVLAVENFNSAGLSVTQLGGNSLSMMVKAADAVKGNLAVQLEGVASPVILALAVGQRQVDHLVEMQLPQALPRVQTLAGNREALAPMVSWPNAPATPASPIRANLRDFLWGTVPQTARLLTPSVPGVRAWQLDGNTLVVQSDVVVASPAYLARESLPDGSTVYELPLTSQVMLSAKGQTTTVYLTGVDQQVQK